MKAYNNNNQGRIIKKKKNKIKSWKIIGVFMGLGGFFFGVHALAGQMTAVKPETVQSKKVETKEYVEVPVANAEPQESNGQNTKAEQVKPTEEKEIAPTTDDRIQETNGVMEGTLQSVAGDLPYFNQEDVRWGTLNYGPQDPIATHGCGPTAMATVISGLTEESIDPKEMSDWSYNNGYCYAGEGSAHALIPESARSFGLESEGMGYPSIEQIRQTLSEGKLIVALMGYGTFSPETGHFIIIRYLNEDGTVRISDSVEVVHTEQDWDIEHLLDEASPVSAAGGPFWAIWR